jgi:sensor histidine kinase YesM
MSLKTIAWQLIFWACLFLYEWLPSSSIHDCTQVALHAAALNVPIIMIATYLTIFAVEKFLLQKKYIPFALVSLAIMVASGIGRRAVNFFAIYKALYPNKPMALWYFPKITIDAVNVMLFAVLGAMIYLFRKWLEQQRVTEELMKEKVAAELALLKSQVQPHFIFNTLNNIYMLSLKNSPMTSDMIYRLSALLSYMLYDTKRQFIEVEKEIEYVKNYINLEKIRYGEHLDVQMNVFNNVKGVQVPPLLFLPLVENAFKHGVSNAVEDCWIHIDVSLKKDALIFKIENSTIKEKCDTNGFGNGLGLDNLRKRLDILYPNRHDLKTMQDECSHLAVLKLDFTPNTEGVYFQENPIAKKEKNQFTTSLELALKSIFVFLKL